MDDHVDTCTGMKMMLERRGYDISVAHSADQAVEKARSEHFDLLISDIGLPDRSGYELMSELRANQQSGRNRAQRFWSGSGRGSARKTQVFPSTLRSRLISSGSSKPSAGSWNPNPDFALLSFAAR